MIAGLQPRRRRRKRQPLGPAQRHQIARRLDLQVVGARLDRHPLGGRDQGQIDRASPAGIAFAGRQRRHRRETVAHQRVGQPDRLGRPGHARHQGRRSVVGPAHLDARGRRRRSAQRHGPGPALPLRRHGQIVGRGNPHGGIARPCRPTRVPGRPQLFGAGHVHPRGGVEHDPHRIAAPENGRPDRRAPLEGQHRLVGAGLGLDRHDRIRGRRLGRVPALRRLARRIEVQPDRPVRHARAGVGALLQGDDQVRAAAGARGPGFDRLHPGGRIDLQAGHVGRRRRAQPHHHLVALAADARAHADHAAELDAGELGVLADADGQRIARPPRLLRQGRQRREHDGAGRGGRHGRLQNTLCRRGPGHIPRPMPHKPFNRG